MEHLERRVLMCADHQLSAANAIELMQPIVNRPVKTATPSKTTAGAAKGGSTATPSATGGGTLNSAPGDADIIWLNRATTTTGGVGDTDAFGASFGTSAPLARAVVDAVIVAYERMIGSFNYGAALSYSLSLSMSGGGFGAGANLTFTLGGKPIGGTISMGSGNGSVDANDTNGWFMDPTPFESSEFQGPITNAFSGDAQGGSPAAGVGDFYTVVAAEMTHCMGLFGSAMTLWSSHTTNTAIADTAEGGGRGTFYTFVGPSIKHLLTSNNGGPNGSNFGSAVHGAGPATISFGGDSYTGSQDQGNAVYEFGRRYTINNAFALMFKDAYN
jgi:hypothetical protein